MNTKKFKITDIQWDTDGFEVDIPTETEVEWEVSNGSFDDIDVEDEISNWLSDTYGWCHNGFKYEEVK